jgi:hypothetical protein
VIGELEHDVGDSRALARLEGRDGREVREEIAAERTRIRIEKDLAVAVVRDVRLVGVRSLQEVCESVAPIVLEAQRHGVPARGRQARGEAGFGVVERAALSEGDRGPG